MTQLSVPNLVTLAPSATYSSSTLTPYAAPVTFTTSLTQAVINLQVTQAPSSSIASTLNVYLQDSIDGTTNFYDFMAFPQVQPASTSAMFYQGHWQRSIGITASSSTGQTIGLTDRGFHAALVGQLVAGQVNHGPTGSNWRVYYTISGAPSSSQYQFSVIAQVW